MRTCSAAARTPLFALQGDLGPKRLCSSAEQSPLRRPWTWAPGPALTAPALHTCSPAGEEKWARATGPGLRAGQDAGSDVLPVLHCLTHSPDPSCAYSFCHALTCVLKLIYLQFSSVAQSCPTLCDPMNRSTPGLRVHHQLPEFTQTHVHRVSDAIQPSHPLSSPSPPAPNPSQHQSLFQ